MVVVPSKSLSFSLSLIIVLTHYSRCCWFAVKPQSINYSSIITDDRGGKF